MKKLLILIFSLAILYSPYAYSNFFNNLIGKVSTSDVKLYDRSYTSGVYDVLGNLLPKTNFKAKIQNLNSKTPLKEVHIMIEVLDCKNKCNDCITASRRIYEVLQNEFYGYGENTILRPYSVFQIDKNIDDETLKSSYVQARGNTTCFSSYVHKVKGLNILD